MEFCLWELKFNWEAAQKYMKKVFKIKVIKQNCNIAPNAGGSGLRRNSESN